MSTLERKLMLSFQIVLFAIVIAVVTIAGCIDRAKKEIIQTIHSVATHRAVPTPA